MAQTAPSHLVPLAVAAGAEGVRLAHDAVRSALDGSGPPVALLPDSTSDHAAAQRVCLALGQPADAGSAVAITTSGSSGAPAGVVLGATALRAAASAAHQRLSGGPGRWLVAMPVTAVGGLMTLVRAIDAGIEPVAWAGIGGAQTFTPRSFEPAARDVLRQCEADGAPAYVSLVPTQLARLARGGAEALDLLARFDHVLIGAAALPLSLRDAAEAAGVTLTSTYGASETCGGVVYDGVPLAGVTVTIDDPDDQGVGRVILGGDTIALGYRRPADSPPRADLDALQSGIFRTSDVGRIDNGLVQVLGRTDDIIKVGGTKVSLLALSDAARRLPGVSDVAAIVRDDDEWGQVPVVVIVGSANTAVVSERLSLEVGRSRVVVKRVDSLPYLPNGKIDRMALRQMMGES